MSRLAQYVCSPRTAPMKQAWRYMHWCHIHSCTLVVFNVAREGKLRLFGADGRPDDCICVESDGLQGQLEQKRLCSACTSILCRYTYRSNLELRRVQNAQALILPTSPGSRFACALRACNHLQRTDSARQQTLQRATVGAHSHMRKRRLRVLYQFLHAFGSLSRAVA